MGFALSKRTRVKVVEVSHISRIQHPPLSSGVIEVISILTLDHSLLKSSGHIHSARPEGTDQSSIHRVLIYVETDHRHGLLASRSMLLCERCRLCFFACQICFYFIAIGVVVGQRCIHLCQS